MCKNCYGRNKAKLELLTPKWGPSTFQQRKPLKRTPKPIKPRSDKRAGQEREYKRVMKIIEEGTPVKKCFFCSKDINGEWDKHHLLGRKESLVYDVDNIVFVHRECHTEYHGQSVRKIKWFPAYMGKLLWEDRALLYNREKEKYNK